VAKKATPQSGRDRFDEAVATLIQTQAAFLSRLTETDRRHLEFERETAERFVLPLAETQGMNRYHLLAAEIFGCSYD
jgi:hypothetical protein